MKIDNEKECFSHERTIINFDTLNIPNIIRLGKVEYNQYKNPLEHHMHIDSFEIVFFCTGEMTYYALDEEYSVHSGQFFISKPNELHGSKNNHESKSKFFYLIFNCMPHTKNFLGMTDSETQYIKDTFFSLRDRIFYFDESIIPVMRDITIAYRSDMALKKSYITALLIKLFNTLCDNINNQKRIDNKSVSISLDKVIDVITQNPSKFYTIDELSQLAYMSTSYFKASFKKYTGFTPYNYMVRNKISIAKDMLHHTKKSITAVAFELSYESSQHFATSFKKYTGSTPSEYRSSCKHKNNIDD